MNSQGRSGSLLLVELLFAIMFFAICAAICLQLFVTAKQTGEESHNLDQAVLLAQNVAETWKATESREETLRLIGAEGEAARDALAPVVQFYDGDWGITGEKEYSHALTLTFLGNKLEISISDFGGREIFSISSLIPAKEVAA